MTLSLDRLQAASDLLYRTWMDGAVLPALPPDLRPSTRAEGYAIQALVEHHTGAALFGWKIAATSLAGQRHIGVDAPLAGRLLAERVLSERDATAHSLHGNRMRVAEPELAFRMERDLPPRSAPYTADEVTRAAGALHLAIELPDSRYEDYVHAGAPQLIADDACAHWFVLGPEAPASWRSLDLAAHRVTAGVRGQRAAEGSGANVLGDPRMALAWLANELSGLGVTLRAGAVVTTGTLVTPLGIAPGNTVWADFGSLGGMTVQMADDFAAPVDQRYFEDYVPGSVHEYGPVRIDADEIIAFAKRYDPQYIHTDPRAAAAGPFGGIIASGWHTAAVVMRIFVDHYLSHVASLASPGIDELRWHKPVRPGDQLSARLTVLEARRSTTKPDRGIVRSSIEVRNQNGDVVMSLKPINFLRCRTASAE